MEYEDAETDTLAALHNLCVELSKMVERAKNGHGFVNSALGRVRREAYGCGYVAGLQLALRIAQTARDEHAPDAD